MFASHLEYLYAKDVWKSRPKKFRKIKQWMPHLQAPGVQLGPRKGPLVYRIVTPMKDKSGNKIDPLATASDVESMEDRKKESKVKPSDKVAAFLKECNAQQPDAENERQTILDGVEDNHKDAEDRKAATKQEKKEVTKKNIDAKRKKCDQVLDQLLKLLKHPDLMPKVERRGGTC